MSSVLPLNGSMTLELFIGIVIVQIVLVLFASALSVIRFKQRKSYILLIGLCMFVSALGNLSGFCLLALKINPNYGQSLFHIVELPLICLVYFHAWGKQGARWLIAVNVCYMIFGFANILFIQQASINSYTAIIKEIIILICAIHYFYWLMQKLPSTKLHLLPMFWVNSAWIMLYSGTLFLYVFTAYLVNTLNDNLLVYWSLHNGLTVLEAIIIIYALWMDLRNIKSVY